MNEQDKAMQYAFYAGVLVFFIFGICYFGTSHSDGQRSDGVGARISDSQDLNRELQAGVENSKREVAGTIEQLGSAEQELNRAASAVERCEQILATAKRRTQETNKENK